MDFMTESSTVNFLELQQREGEHIEQQGTTEVFKNWGVTHKQGLASNSNTF